MASTVSKASQVVTVRDKHNLDYVLRTGLAGGIAGSVAKTVVAPLDRVKILFQASNPEFQKYAGSWTGVFAAARRIHAEFGVRGLFQGHSATLLRVFPYAAIKFMTYEQAHHFLMPTREQETNLKRFVAGSISGTISVLFTYPLELVRVRLAYFTRSPSTINDTSPFRPSLRNVISQVYREGSSINPPKNRIFQNFPILKFYRGFSISIVGMIPYAGTSFLFWGFLRSFILPPPSSSSSAQNIKKTTSTVANLTIGAISGAIGQTAAYPFEVIRRRMQVGGLIQPDRWLGFRETVRDIWSARGWRGFYVGLSIGFVKVLPMTAISFAVWESMKHLLGA